MRPTAGLVYKTDTIKSGDKVSVVDIPDAENAVASYPAASLKASKNADAAAAFVAWLSTPKRRRSSRTRASRRRNRHRAQQHKQPQPQPQ